MASLKSGRRKLFLVVLMVIADTARAKVLPLSSVRSDTASSRKHDDLPAATSGTAPRIDDLPAATSGTAPRIDDLPDATSGTAPRIDDLPAATSGTAPRIDDDLSEADRLKSESEHLVAELIDTASKEDDNSGTSVYQNSDDKDDLIEHDHLKSALEHLIDAMIDTATKEDDNPGPSEYQDSDDEELSKKVDYIMKRREEMMTDDMEIRTVQMMRDIGDYNRRLDDLGDVKDTIREKCGEDVLNAVDEVSVNLGQKQDAINVLSVVALLQLHSCPSAAASITSRLLEAVEEETPKIADDFAQRHEDENDWIAEEHDNEDGISTESYQEEYEIISEELDMDSPPSHARESEGKAEETRSEAFPVLSSFDHCNHVADCKRTGIPAVRQQLAAHPSLRTVYDEAVAAVFASTHPESVSKALLDDVTADLNVTSPQGDFNITDHFRLRKRDSCEDPKEAKAQSVISWIPFVGTIYNLVSSAVYAGKGCTDVAKERAIEGTVDVVLDVGTVLTAGTGAAAFQGAKALVKGATKQAAKTVAKETFTKVTKGLAKETVQGYMNPVRGAIREGKDLLEGVTSLASSIHKGVKGSPSGVLRCRRQAKRCRDPTSSEKLFLKEVDDTFGQRGTPELQAKHEQRWEDLWNKYKIEDVNLLPHTKTGKLYKGIKGIDLTNSDLTNKQLFQTLQQKAADMGPLFVKQNLGGVDVQYIADKQIFKQSRDQVFIKFPEKNKNGNVVFKGPTYKDITKKLDDFSETLGDAAASKRKKMADAMWKAINSEPSPNAPGDLKKVLCPDSKTDACGAASEFLVLSHLAESVPGRIQGYDGYFRAGLRHIASTGSTFSEFIRNAGLLTGHRQLGNTRTFLRGSNEVTRLFHFHKTGSDIERVREMLNRVSIPDRRR